MRKIDKGTPLASFSEFVRTHHPVKWEDAKGVSRVWREYILEYEQHRLSGYTEEPLRLDRTHIDHFRKQSLFNALIYDWSNFVVDGVDENKGAKFKDKYVKTCEDNAMLINPVTEDASRFFQYELNGNISVVDGLNPTDTVRANYTINAFNLNEASLSERRRKIINTILYAYYDLSDDLILEALEAEGFKSVVEQLLKERKQEEDFNDDQETRNGRMDS